MMKKESVENYDAIIARSPSHGETYDIIHIWGRTLDAVFLHSKYLTMDRSEKKSSVDKDGYQRSYDGIIRSLSPYTRWDIGFVEVKSYDKSVELDKVKIIDVLVRSLENISQVITNGDMAKVLVFGICCQGVEITVYSACRVWNQVFLIEEFKYDYSKEVEPLFRFLEICWSLKLACENTYELIKTSSRRGFGG
ncbi:hypothetical protein BGX38DRAFT_1229181 [Terfezia claveryi]|nr:hypothetical protein BGX38DRAFT_1229181 [Terfezia claveryi]